VQVAREVDVDEGALDPGIALGSDSLAPEIDSMVRRRRSYEASYSPTSCAGERSACCSARRLATELRVVARDCVVGRLKVAVFVDHLPFAGFAPVEVGQPKRVAGDRAAIDARREA
jgi:hypothetical protein